MALSLVPPTLPEDYCDLTEQEQANLLITGTTVVGSTDASFIISFATPGINDRGKAWLKLEADGTPERIYRFAGGQWIARHNTPPSSDERRLWVGSEASLITYDGGAVGAVTSTTGPMWEVDHLYDNQVPIGAATIPVSVDSGPTTLAIGNANLPFTRLKMFQSGILGSGTTGLTGADSARVGVNVGASEDYVIVAAAAPATEPDLGLTSSFGQATPTALAVLTSKRGTFFIKRTARIFYVA